MTRYLLDTNIISDAVEPVPSAALRDWMMSVADADLFTTSLNIAEIRRGILQLPHGKKRRDLEKWFEGPIGPFAIFSGRILPFDEQAGLVWAHLMAEVQTHGRPRNALDMIVAAVARANGCVVVTDNERDFAGLDVFNPLRDGPVEK